MLLALVLVPASPALAGTTIDTTGFAGNTSYPFTVYSPGDMSSDGSDVAQTFIAPTGAQTLTKVAAVMSASSQAQNADLSLWSADDGGPVASLQTTGVTIPSGTGLREFPVSWTVSGGGRYAFVFSVSDAQVTANTALTLPNVGGVDARNVYDGGWVFTRNVPPPAWTSRTDIDVKFRLDFDGGVTTAGGGSPTGGGTGPPAPSAPATTPASPAPPPAAGAPPGPKPPAGPLALRGAASKGAVPASLSCGGATIDTCSVRVAAPKRARSVRVQVLRGSTVVADAALGRAALAKGGRRTLRLKARRAFASGPHVVRLTIVTAKGRTIRQTAAFTA